MVPVNELVGASVLVTGAGVTGRSAARALLDLGAVVTVTDADGERLASLAQALPGVRTRPGLTAPPVGTRLVVTSPGWRPDTPVLAAAAQQAIQVIGEVELAWWLCARMANPPAWLAVTGTNGKTTTVGMLESILRAAGADALACGNVGLPVIDAVTAGHRVLAVELSSFQLHWSPSIRPAAGGLLNIAEDHLDWHGSMSHYTAAKASVLTGPVAIADCDDERTAGLLAAAPATTKVGVTLGPPRPGQFGIRDGLLIDRAFGEEAASGDGVVLARAAEVRPAGPPGCSDALTAAALARAYGVAPTAVEQGLRSFTPGAHRGVLVGEVDGVRYINDSKATNPHAAAASLRAHQQVVWIAGGLLKGAGVDDLVAEVAHRLRGVVLLGTDRQVIAAALARHAPDVPVTVVGAGDHGAMRVPADNTADNTADDGAAVMRQAVCAARELARPGVVVLLAPAAASMDMFTDYAHRGRAFAEAVTTLTRGRRPV